MCTVSQGISAAGMAILAEVALKEMWESHVTAGQQSELDVNCGQQVWTGALGTARHIGARGWWQVRKCSAPHRLPTGWQG